ncbi:MAG: hypothetical protein NT099_08235 [Candidatus Saganbacteria bacterium]|nr:hypothetical protein [Candidatus Saganbacteria bacterium]
MQKVKKVFLNVFFLLVSSVPFVFQSPVFANPTLSDVLNKGGSLQSSQPNALYVALTAGLFFFAALSVTGYKLLRKKGEEEGAVLLVENPKDEEISRLRREVKELTFQNEEINREMSRLLENKNRLFEEKQRLEDVVQSRVIAEELIKKSNESLRRAYDKLLAEKEGLVLEMSQKDFYATLPVNETTEADKQEVLFEVNADTPEKKAELKAVEELINEVGKAISSKEDAPPVKKAKAKVKKNKGKAKKK